MKQELIDLLKQAHSIIYMMPSKTFNSVQKIDLENMMHRLDGMIDKLEENSEEF